MTAAGNDQVRWGFLGAGFVATRAVGPAVHASGYAHLQAAAARDEERAGALEPQNPPTDDYRAVLDDDSVEAVYISLTNEAHLRWITAALEAGKHVLCEKPITVNAGECRTAFAAARSAGLLLVEAAWTQWHPRTRRVDALVSGGELGDVQSISSTFTFNGVPPDNYRLVPARGGGSLLDVGPYILRPAATWVPNAWSLEIVNRKTSEVGTDLRTSATLNTQDGKKAEVLASFIDPEHQSLRIEADAAAITYGSPAFTSWREVADIAIADGSKTWSESFASCDAYELMISSVSRRIRGDLEAYVISEGESVRCMELIDLVNDGCASPL